MLFWRLWNVASLLSHASVFVRAMLACWKSMQTVERHFARKSLRYIIVFASFVSLWGYVKSFPSHKKTYMVHWSLLPYASARHQFTLPFHILAFVHTHCTYPWRHGQAELTSVVWLHMPQTVTHLITNMVHRRVTLLMWPTMLPLDQGANFVRLATSISNAEVIVVVRMFL